MVYTVCVDAGIIILVIPSEAYRSSLGVSARIYVLDVNVIFVCNVHVSYFVLLFCAVRAC